VVLELSSSSTSEVVAVMSGFIVWEISSWIYDLIQFSFFPFKWFCNICWRTQREMMYLVEQIKWVSWMRMNLNEQPPPTDT